jgi:hypothetical protein
MRLTALSLALAAALAGCGNAAPPAGADTPVASTGTAASTEDALTMEVADALQACSYDGSPVNVPRASVGGAAPRDCRDMVERIMAATGLPQNFDLVEAPVPNAAAMIVIGDDKLPHRVIAFNQDFLDEVRRATGDEAWAPVSIMAHEVGHHLSGHTITPGGSQPPIELEADKFSGFVLYRMGAGRDEATRAILALGPEKDGPTHPNRDRRAAAIAEGWTQACTQQGGANCAGGGGIAKAPAASPVRPAAPVAAPRQPVVAAAPAAIGTDALPAPDADAIPAKFDRFIYDTTGMVEPEVRAKYEAELFAHARDHGVELVTLVVDDLHGLDGDAYAWAMLRQLRVGKLDVGNGAVLVYAPKQQQVGLAMGPGVALAMGIDDAKDLAQRKQGMARTLGTIAFSCKHGCKGGSSDLFLLATDHFRRDTDDVEWTIRYPDYGTLFAAHKQAFDARRAGGKDEDPTAHAIARVHGTVVAIDPADRDNGARVNTALRSQGFVPVHVRTAEGHAAMLYVTPATQALMPGGALQVGGKYAFIARTRFLSWNPKDTQSFALLSYDRVD